MKKYLFFIVLILYLTAQPAHADFLSNIYNGGYVSASSALHIRESGQKDADGKMYSLETSPILLTDITFLIKFYDIDCSFWGSIPTARLGSDGSILHFGSSVEHIFENDWGLYADAEIYLLSGNVSSSSENIDYDELQLRLKFLGEYNFSPLL